MRKSRRSKAIIECRLQGWRRELLTNQHGMAHLAQRCIKLLETELRLYEALREPQEARGGGGGN